MSQQTRPEIEEQIVPLVALGRGQPSHHEREASLRGGGRRRGVPRWIEPSFARAIALADRIRSVEPDPPFRTHAQRAIYRAGTSGTQVYSTELCERSAAEHGIEERHPYHDRRLVEFMLAVPEEQRWHGPETKRSLRLAMRGLLPEAVRQRHVQADFSALFALSIEDLGGEDFFSRLAVAAAGWVNADEAQAMCRRMQALRARGDEAYIQEIWPLWAIASTEIWYRVNVCPADGDHTRVHGG
jgi:asparagine synthase (glutamine-hydrolysing)